LLLGFAEEEPRSLIIATVSLSSPPFWNVDLLARRRFIHTIPIYPRSPVNQIASFVTTILYLFTLDSFNLAYMNLPFFLVVCRVIRFRSTLKICRLGFALFVRDSRNFQRVMFRGFRLHPLLVTFISPFFPDSRGEICTFPLLNLRFCCPDPSGFFASVDLE